jgi:drug/metabolite transporter (DMT)-like permease
MIMNNTLAICLASVAISVLAQFTLKAGVAGAAVKAALAQPLGVQTLVALFLNGFVVLGFMLYGLGAVIWLAVLARWEVSKAYPMVGLGFALAVSIGWLAGEQVTALRLLGVGLVCIGIVCVAAS